MTQAPFAPSQDPAHAVELEGVLYYSLSRSQTPFKIWRFRGLCYSGHRPQGDEMFQLSRQDVKCLRDAVALARHYSCPVMVEAPDPVAEDWICVLPELLLETQFIRADDMPAHAKRSKVDPFGRTYLKISLLSPSNKA